jgi:uncharacterized membrane protein YcaP (DUF421 family)
VEIILRSLAVYAIVWLVFRVSGKRTLKDLTTFDFVLLLIISECTQQALIGQDYSITGAGLAIMSLVGADIGLSLLKRRFSKVEKVLDSVPVLLIEKGRLHSDRMSKERIDEADILSSAREGYGIASLEQIDYAILETNGSISIIAKERRGSPEEAAHPA